MYACSCIIIRICTYVLGLHYDFVHTGIAYYSTAGISQYLKICYLHHDLVHSLCILWLAGHWTISSKGIYTE